MIHRKIDNCIEEEKTKLPRDYSISYNIENCIFEVAQSMHDTGDDWPTIEMFIKSQVLTFAKHWESDTN